MFKIINFVFLSDIDVNLKNKESLILFTNLNNKNILFMKDEEIKINNNLYKCIIY